MLPDCLAALTAALGLPPEPYAGDGPFRLRVGDDYDLFVEGRGNGPALSLTIAPAPRPARERREFLRDALKISLRLMTAGRVFSRPSLDQGGNLCLSARVPGEPRAFVEGVESFLNEADKWRLALNVRERP